MAIPGNGAPPINDVITAMLGHLEGEVPPNRARLLSAQERPVGLANWRGVEVFGSLVPVALKGGRLEAGVLFEVSRPDPVQAETAALELHGNLIAARDELRGLGFLRIDGPEFSLPQEDAGGGTFRKTISYRVLFEYQYMDVDGSASFITRIPTRVDRDEADRESFLITGRMVRWQREEAAQEIPPPPTLVVQGRTTVRGLTVAVFLGLPFPAAGVELLRTFEGAEGAPAVAATLKDLAGAPHIRKTYPSLADFLADLAGETYPSLEDFLADFATAKESVELSDLEGKPGSYVLQTFTFGPALDLPRPIDRLEISTSAGAWVASNAVVYLRAEGA